MDCVPINRISIQVSLSGYSFKVEQDGALFVQTWQSPERIFTTNEFFTRYAVVDIALFTHKFTLVPFSFFSPTLANQILSDVVILDEADVVQYILLEELNAYLVYSNSIGESLSKTIANMVLLEDGSVPNIYPEVYYMLKSLHICKDYNKIIASYKDGYLHLVVAQGKSLLICNSYASADFTTAQYFIFLVMNKLQLNPEVSTICFRTPLSPDQEISLYRYFKAVDYL